MKTSAKMITVLTLTAMISGGVLSFYNLFTVPRVEAHQNKELQEAVDIVLPGIVSYEEKSMGEGVFYIGKNKKGEVIGVAFIASGYGFQGKIVMLVGMDPELEKIMGLRVLQQIETPGLGTKIVDDPGRENRHWFTDQFRNLEVLPEITYVKNQKPTKPGEIQAITGATISSESIVNILNATIKQNREIYFEMENKCLNRRLPF